MYHHGFVYVHVDLKLELKQTLKSDIKGLVNKLKFNLLFYYHIKWFHYENNVIRCWQIDSNEHFY